MQRSVEQRSFGKVLAVLKVMRKFWRCFFARFSVRGVRPSRPGPRVSAAMKHASALSGGQRQRVAIGRAIVSEPGVFLLDEPLSNLDATLRGQTRIEIARLHKQFAKASAVYVTHDQIEAMTFADKIVLLHAGKDTERYMRPPRLDWVAYSFGFNRLMLAIRRVPALLILPVARCHAHGIHRGT